ncbi:50S ribosomal protein L29 [Desulforhopalus vacuolatus]|uniref:50S ribosomal protein L29 n=1 Tax=Desulforhopalus vacuolatus TaxID=40414 RepID=UPI0019652F65|nr:50S ribosomal protein L29 [Desulforhopalus vacuolatus]MBM9518838.1 50S ribosomal protein L29 [Desulforhopalus vacuolatus]
MKIDEIRNMSAEDMDDKLKNLRVELGRISFQHRLRPLEDTSRLKKIRTDIARIETVKRASAN